MLYIKPTSKTVERAFADLEASIARNGFGLLHSYDFRKTLGDKGFPMESECRVLEVCNPKQASEVLAVPDDAPYRFGLSEAVSPLRLRGMVAMLSRIKRQVRLRSAA